MDVSRVVTLPTTYLAAENFLLLVHRGKLEHLPNMKLCLVSIPSRTNKLKKHPKLFSTPTIFKSWSSP